MKKLFSSKKRYYVPGIDPQLHQFVETPASKELTEKRRFIVTTVISSIAALAAIASTIIVLVK